MGLFTRHSLHLQTAYSDLKRRAMEQARLLVGTPGTVDERLVKGSRFFYRQFYDAQGKKSAEYIGPVGQAEAEARAAAARDAIALTNALIAEARDLARNGYARLDQRAGAILASLANHGLFRAGALLVGSHAYGALLNELGVRGAAYVTEDIDIARPRPLEIAVPSDVGFAKMLADSTVPLLPVPSLDRKAPPTSYLVPARGDEITTRAVPELDAHATALPFLGYLLAEPIEAIVLGREAVVPVKLPRPEAFTWHKMLVSELRGETREKRAKDAHQAAALFAVLAEDAPDTLERAFAALPHGTRTKTRLGARRVLTALETAGHARAHETLAALLR